MWATGQGDRVLSVFDRMSLPEKLAVLEHVAKGLLETAVPCAELTAVSEAAIGAIYQQLVTDVAQDIRDDTSITRELIVELLSQIDYDDPPDAEATDMQEWREHIECLLDRIVWDRDWDEEFVQPDDPPEVARATREFASISENYYSAVPPDPNPAQLARIRQNLERLSMAESFRCSDHS